MERSFTPEEASAALDEVRPLAERMVAAKHALDRAEERRDEAAGHIRGNGGGISPQELAELDEDVERAATEIAGALAELQALGVLVKDIDAGLVDFLSVRDGEPVLLCWRLGEEEVTFWHGLEDGFSGRRPL